MEVLLGVDVSRQRHEGRADVEEALERLAVDVDGAQPRGERVLVLLQPRGDLGEQAPAVLVVRRQRCVGLPVVVGSARRGARARGARAETPATSMQIRAETRSPSRPLRRPSSRTSCGSAAVASWGSQIFLGFFGALLRCETFPGLLRLGCCLRLPACEPRS